MAIKADRWIRQMAETYGMIDPFSSSQVAEGMISYGLSSYGYDLRLADDFKILAPPPGVTLNPKSIPPEYYRDHRGPFCDIPPNGYILGRTLEYLRIPRDVLTVCMAKPTDAATDVLINVPPHEPAREGVLAAAIENMTPVLVRVFDKEGICQVLFFQADEDYEVSYKDGKGEYQAGAQEESPKFE